MDVPFTDEDLEAIDRAIATGELSVEYADRRVTYRSIEELKKARDIILNKLNGRPRQTLGVTDKGL